MIVGNDGIDWEPFANAAACFRGRLEGELERLFDDFKPEDLTQSSIDGFLDLRSVTLQHHGGLGFDSLLDKTSIMNCFDPRDRLYAIRSLALPECRELIIPDYGNGVEEVFRDFTVRIIGADERGINILTRCMLRNTPSTLQMPSWVPDFSSCSDTVLNPGFNASGRSRFGGEVSNESLPLQAVKLATITTVMPPLQPGYTNIEIIKACRSWG